MAGAMGSMSLLSLGLDIGVWARTEVGRCNGDRRIGEDNADEMLEDCIGWSLNLEKM